MAKRGLQRWLERREHLHTLLVARHALVHRRPPPQRLLQALGLAAVDDGAADGVADTGRQFVPPMLGMPKTPISGLSDFAPLPYPAVEGEMWMAAPDITPPGVRSSEATDPGLSDAPPLDALTTPTSQRAVEVTREEAAPQTPAVAATSPTQGATMHAADPSPEPIALADIAASDVRGKDQPHVSRDPVERRDLASADDSSTRPVTDDDGKPDRSRSAADVAVPPVQEPLVEAALEDALVEESLGDEQRVETLGRARDEPVTRPADRVIAKPPATPTESTPHLPPVDADRAAFTPDPDEIGAAHPSPAAPAVAADARPTTTPVRDDVPVERDAATTTPVASASDPGVNVGDVAAAALPDEAPPAPIARRPVIEERHTRRAPPPRKGSEPKPAGRRPERPRQSDARAPLAPLFVETKHPERTAQDWMRLLIDATETAEPAVSPPGASPVPPATVSATRPPVASPLERRPGSSVAPRAGAPLRPVARPPAQAPTRPGREAGPAARTQTVMPALESQSATTTPDPTPLLDTTRRFLRPLVGVDPDTVRVYRGVAGAQLASRRGADALTIGDAVVLPPTHAEREPETLGLVAHELTHVARRRDPTFVPPMLRPPTAAPTVERGVVDGGSPRDASPAPTEESIASAVEAGVRLAATDTGAADDASSPPAALQRDSRRRDPRWGTLPAPWEPIPELEDTPAVTPGRARDATPATAVSAPGRHADDSRVENDPYRRTRRPDARETNVSGGRSHDLASTPEVWHADTGRTIASAPESAASPHAAPSVDKPKPDMDGLARQVYDILKRCLAAEQRRGA